MVKSFVLRDEIYEMKNYSRDNVRVLMRLDAAKIDWEISSSIVPIATSPHVGQDVRQRTRVLHTLGHVQNNWDNPEFPEHAHRSHQVDNGYHQCRHNSAAIGLKVNRLGTGSSYRGSTVKDSSENERAYTPPAGPHSAFWLRCPPRARSCWSRC